MLSPALIGRISEGASQIEVSVDDDGFVAIWYPKQPADPLYLGADEARELALFLTRAADRANPRKLGIGSGVTGFVS